MPRPPALKDNEPTKMFTVSEHRSMWDNNNERKNGGDTIELSFEQAKYFKALGVIEVPLEDFSNEPTAKVDPPKASDGDETKSAGKPAMGKPRPLPTAKAEGDNNSDD